ncbi:MULTISPECIES: SMP-30/gluconolactonase/LRE family protein [unclassified Arenibacter]|uniref:SMP-30/gluconolactonase/LRE family protein n=1 Tax=unclassified Arenibacter TaxID=2615047 RepID=UPI000E34CB7D|nr:MULTISPECIES: SMP-30/gluconolactonase/LRE family protein [unclassified Arenibacter]MCM4162287.1 SMP-30/gluconolaconase/LRE domain protein [Arenibacter sp. A80]RFT57890.1 SMP-30/gluconolactonase/LRE family protein [Arenibacter sp. P308M17]
MGLEVVSGIICELGEGPLWDHSKKQICWVDILNGNIHEWSPKTNTSTTISVGQMIGTMAISNNGNYMAAMKDGFGFVDRKTGKVDMVANPEKALPGNRFNDGKCDPEGRFWAGTMPVSEKESSGSLYVLDASLNVRKKESNISVSNGLAWSLDHKTMYFIDSPTRKVVGYDYDRTNGELANKRTVITIAEQDGFPDGMTIDQEGMLWVAHWGGWQVARYDPGTGKKLFSVAMPVSQVTSCTFGGETMEDLYITSARKGLGKEELEKQPLAGSLFVVRNCGHKGLPANKFKTKV